MRKLKFLSFGRRKVLPNPPKGEIPEHLEYPDCSMVDMVMSAAEKYPKNMAYSYYGHEVTYREFVREIKTTAKALKKLGVKEGDTVTICMANTPEGVMSVYAVNMVGAICNMVHPLSSENELEYYINSAKSQYLIVIDAVADKIQRIRKRTKLKKIVVATPFERWASPMKTVYHIAKIRDTVKRFFRFHGMISWGSFQSGALQYFAKDYYVPRDGNDPAAILYTGGTTGAQMGVLLSNNNFNAVGLQSTTVVRKSVPGSTVLSILPLFHSFGLGMCIHAPLTKGMGCILIPKFDAKKFASIIRRYQPNFIAGVPTLFAALMQNEFGPKELACVTSAISGGDVLDPTLAKELDKFLKKHGSSAKVQVGYGLTESCGACCLSPEGRYKAGMIGAAFPDCEMKIVLLGTHETAPTGRDGEICISGPTVMLGYMGNEAETMQALRYHDDGKLWLHTGDMGRKDKDGLVYFSQRIKRIIVSSGYNVYPTYIESIINTHKKVLTSTVIGVPHPYRGQVPKAFVVLKNGYKPDAKLERELRELCAKNIAKYALPKEFVFRDKLPQTKVGKVAFHELEKS